MRTVKVLALVYGNTLLGVHAIFQNGETVKLPITRQTWENRKLMQEFIKRLLRNNHMKVNGYKLAESNVYNIYYIDVETLTVERRLS